MFLLLLLLLLLFIPYYFFFAFQLLLSCFLLSCYPHAYTPASQQRADETWFRLNIFWRFHESDFHYFFFCVDTASNFSLYFQFSSTELKFHLFLVVTNFSITSVRLADDSILSGLMLHYGTLGIKSSTLCWLSQLNLIIYKEIPHLHTIFSISFWPFFFLFFAYCNAPHTWNSLIKFTKIRPANEMQLRNCTHFSSSRRVSSHFTSLALVYVVRLREIETMAIELFSLYEFQRFKATASLVFMPPRRCILCTWLLLRY